MSNDALVSSEEMTGEEMADVYKERIKKWMSTLSSGEFAQGVGQLCWKTTRDDCVDKYCCLGVGCETFRKVEGIGLWSGNDVRTIFIIDADTPSSSRFAIMPQEVYEWFGLHVWEKEVEKITKKLPQDILHTCNDLLKMDFSEIAEIIKWLGDPLSYKKSLVGLTKKIKVASTALVRGV